jgi:CheY-like chemotaxis protein
MINKRPILLLEDDHVDAMIVERALKDLKVENKLIVAKNGEEGLEYLRDIEKHLPGIILLDLNMPRMNGLEFLDIVKKDDQFKKIPIVVLTTSDEEKDRSASFNLGIAGYMTKPVNYPQFVEVLRTITLYWSLSKMP